MFRRTLFFDCSLRHAYCYCVCCTVAFYTYRIFLPPYTFYTEHLPSAFGCVHLPLYHNNAGISTHIPPRTGTFWRRYMVYCLLLYSRYASSLLSLPHSTLFVAVYAG